MKLRFIEPANQPYHPDIRNLFVYDQYIRTPSNGLLTLATIASNMWRIPGCTASPSPGFH